MKAKRVQYKLIRSMCSSFVGETYAHELSIIAAVHPAGTVEVLDPLHDQPPVDLDPAEEFQRLESVYGMRNEKDSFVEAVYGMFQARKFAAAVEAETGDYLPESEPEQPPASKKEKAA